MLVAINKNTLFLFQRISREREQEKNPLKRLLFVDYLKSFAIGLVEYEKFGAEEQDNSYA